jgi:thiol-disulfide isomerase/thioredoxin
MTVRGASAGGRAWHRRPGALLLLIALVAGAAAFQYVGRNAAGDHGPLRFVVQAEPRPLPPLAFVDGDGKAVDLAQRRGKVVLLNIWATWCAPCRREMPSLDRLQASLGGDGFEVVALSIDQGAGGLAAVKAFYAELGLRHLRVLSRRCRTVGLRAWRRRRSRHLPGRPRGSRSRPARRPGRMGRCRGRVPDPPSPRRGRSALKRGRGAGGTRCSGRRPPPSPPR